jgi:hypothetical protein
MPTLAQAASRAASVQGGAAPARTQARTRRQRAGNAKASPQLPTIIAIESPT